MKRVGAAIHYTLKCTELEGLAITKTAKAIKYRLAEYKSILKHPRFNNC